MYIFFLGGHFHGETWTKKNSENPSHWTGIFLKYTFIYFNWRLITLQYCIGFAIHQHLKGCMQSSVHSSTFYNSQDMETAQVPINR